jgi:hypothetical protein
LGKDMADNPSNIPGAPQGAEPMKKSTGKVQPKKETVRINLPPKPSAAPTIKLPTLPPGGPTGVPTMAAPSAAAPAAAPSAPRSATAAPSIQRPQAATTSQPRPAPPAAAPRVQTISTADKILAIAALVATLAAVGSTVYLAFLLKDTTAM